MNKKIVFVILHYNEITYTKKCIESIREKKIDSYKIIVVDNKSPNLTGEILKEEYKTSIDVEIILNKENYGFSKGNNIGCKRAKELNPDYLCVLNNDVEIETESFFIEIEKEYIQNKFHVLGPLIWNTKLNCNQNYFKVINSKKGAEQRLKETKRAYYFSKYNMWIFFRLYNFIKRILKINNEIQKENGLHGSCLIFSKDYIKKYDKVFLEKSFMYCEENFLNFRKIRDNLKFTYSEKIKVFHHESVSTKRSQKNEKEKRKFVTKNMYLPSIELYKMYSELEGSGK